MENNYLDYLKTAPQTVVSSQNLGTIGKKDIQTINNQIQETAKTIMDTGLQNVDQSSPDIKENTIRNSPLNDILSFDDYQQLINTFKSFILKKYGNSWYSKDIKINMFSGLLTEASELINTLFPINGEVNIENLNIAKILDKLANMYFYIFLLFIHENDDMSIYSLLNSYIKLSEDTKFNRDSGLIFHNAWDTLVLPISIKQPHLILIKLLDFWFGMDMDWEDLKKRINIKILIEEKNN